MLKSPTSSWTRLIRQRRTAEYAVVVRGSAFEGAGAAPWPKIILTKPRPAIASLARSLFDEAGKFAKICSANPAQDSFQSEVVPGSVETLRARKRLVVT